MIDWQRVNTLRDDVGAEDFEEVVELFIEEVEQVINRLKDSPNTDTLGADLHFLKGGAQGLGFSAFSSLCQTGETQCASAQAPQVNLPEILSVYAASKQLFLEQLPTALEG